MHKSFWALLGLVCVSLGCRSAGPASGRASILVDSIHAHNALVLTPENDPYNYHIAYGYRTAFDYLKERGVKVDEARDGKITAQRLAGHSMLFVNLVSADLPVYGADEILAIHRFVEGGGGLLLITDHSNCYFHLNKLAPLLDVLDIQMRPETACEYPPHTLGWVTGGWMWVERFAEHPITQGLHTIAFQTGGTVDDRFAVARTSDRAWADHAIIPPFGEGANMGFYGNWKPEPGERIGSLGVVLAKNVGAGRIVIVADQNCFGDPFINYADNWRLLLNSVAWLSGDAPLRDAAAYRSWRGPAVLCYERFDHAAFGDFQPRGYFNAYAQLTRAFPAFATDRLEGNWGAIVFAHPDYQLAPEDLDRVVAHLQARKSIVILNGRAPAKPGALLDQLSARLGTPEARTAGRLAVMEWAQSGRVLVLAEPDDILLLPPPEKRPDPLDQSRINQLTATVRMAITGRENP